MSRIVDYELFEVPPRWQFLRLETSDGRIGWGEPIVEGRARTVGTAVGELLENYLLGENPDQIEDHWHKMYRGGFYRGGPILMSSLAGIDQALWDLKGKALDSPIFDLLGGRVRDRIRVYQWIGGDQPDEVGEAAKEKIQEGFTALKMNATSELRRVDTPGAIDDAVERLAEVRDIVGQEIDIAVDFHGRATKSMAKRLVKALEPYDPMFFEEPVLPAYYDAIPEVAKHTSVPIATGERSFTRWDFKPLFNQGYIDIIQPDLSHAGGITETRKIASMAEAYDISLAPHCPLGPIALAACLQVDACTSNVLIQEQSLDIHYNQDAGLLNYLKDPQVFDFEDGYVSLLKGPGLGIELDEPLIREQSGKVDWNNPIWRNRDGSITEW